MPTRRTERLWQASARLPSLWRWVVRWIILLIYRWLKNLYVKSSLTHSLENLDNALAVISNSEERLKYAQFWFLRMTPLDDEAFELLFSGKVDDAISVWNREDNLSSLQNRMIIYLWKCDFKPALQKAEQIYKLFPNDFLKAVDSTGTLAKGSYDMIQSFIDTLVAYITPKNLIDSIPSPFWLDYIIPTVTDDTLTKINKAIQDAKDDLDLLNNEGRKVASVLPKDGIGVKLLDDTKDEYNLLKRVSSSDNPRFQLVSDSLANMLYECSIDEYNIRKFSPNYSITLLQNALIVSNNSMDKEEINSKIQLFQKKVERKKSNQNSQSFNENMKDLFLIVFGLALFPFVAMAVIIIIATIINCFN